MTSIVDLIVIGFLVFVLWVVTSLAIFFCSKMFLTRNRLDKRLRSIVEKRQDTPTKVHQVAFKPTITKYGSLSLVGQLVGLIRKIPFLKEDEIVLKFNQAGWMSNRALWIYSASKLFFMALAIDFSMYIMNRTTPSHFTRLMIAGGALVLGWFAINIILNRSVKKRLRIIDTGFIQAVDLIIVCVGAGMNFTKSLERVSREMGRFNKGVAHELETTRKELTILLNRKQALINLNIRVPTRTIKDFTTVISQSFQQGTPILQALTLLSKEERRRRLQTAEITAARLPSTVAIPLVLFMLPSLLLVILGPPLSHLFDVLRSQH
ncbi:MAG: type II secretion system F family protein [Alphaproteobacteria bacterium]